MQHPIFIEKITLNVKWQLPHHLGQPRHNKYTNYMNALYSNDLSYTCRPTYLPIQWILLVINMCNSSLCEKNLSFGVIPHNPYLQFFHLERQNLHFFVAIFTSSLLKLFVNWKFQIFILYFCLKCTSSFLHLHSSPEVGQTPELGGSQFQISEIIEKNSKHVEAKEDWLKISEISGILW